MALSLAWLALAASSPAQDSVGTAFTYQGRLTTEDGEAVSGAFEIYFRLYDQPDEGQQIGPTIFRERLIDRDGLIVEDLDFGPEAFSGQARWLELSLRPTDSPGPVTLMTPRQPVRPTPYVIYSGAGGGPMDLDVQVGRLRIGTAQLGGRLDGIVRTVRSGGSAPFTYDWTILDSSGADATGLFSDDATSGPSRPAFKTSDSEAIDWDLPLSASIAPDTYRLVCVLTDGAGFQVTRSASMMIGDPLSVEWLFPSAWLGPGVPAPFQIRVHGGRPDYVLELAAVDGRGEPAGRLLGSYPLSTGQSMSEDVFAPDGAVHGAHRLVLQVSDADGLRLRSAFQLQVMPSGSLLQVERIIDPVPAQTDLAVQTGAIEPGQALTDAGSTTILSPDVDLPDHPRNLSILLTDAGGPGMLIVTEITILGRDAAGEDLLETITNPPNGETIESGSAFGHVAEIVARHVGTDDGDAIEVGLGSRFGLAAAPAGSSDAAARGAFQIVAWGERLDTEPEQASFLDPLDPLQFELGGIADGQPTELGRLHVRFPAHPPDGATDYVLQYIPAP